MALRRVALTKFCSFTAFTSRKKLNKCFKFSLKDPYKQIICLFLKMSKEDRNKDFTCKKELNLKARLNCEFL